MARDWIKMRTDLDRSFTVLQMSRSLGLSTAEMILKLYQLTCWLSAHGKYGNLESRHVECVDSLFCDGLVAELKNAGWCKEENNWVMFSGFTKAHTERKSISRGIRQKVLSPGKCKRCDSTENLEVDHDMPVSRGGSSELSNLICLCRKCNSAKSTKTYSEFLEAC